MVHHHPQRWLVLALSCFLMLGNYYCFDNPAALKSQLQQRFGTYAKDAFELRFVRLSCCVPPLTYYPVAHPNLSC